MLMVCVYVIPSESFIKSAIAFQGAFPLIRASEIREEMAGIAEFVSLGAVPVL